MFTAMYFKDGSIVSEEFATYEEAVAKCVWASSYNMGVPPVVPEDQRDFRSKTRLDELNELINKNEKELAKYVSDGSIAKTLIDKIVELRIERAFIDIKRKSK